MSISAYKKIKKSKHMSTKNNPYFILSNKTTSIISILLHLCIELFYLQLHTNADFFIYILYKNETVSSIDF